MKKIKIAIWGINVVLIAVILFLVLGNGFKNDNNKTDYKTYIMIGIIVMYVVLIILWTIYVFRETKK